VPRRASDTKFTIAIDISSTGEVYRAVYQWREDAASDEDEMNSGFISGGHVQP
jgi:hypothetical protein